MITARPTSNTMMPVRALSARSVTTGGALRRTSSELEIDECICLIRPHQSDHECACQSESHAPADRRVRETILRPGGFEIHIQNQQWNREYRQKQKRRRELRAPVPVSQSLQHLPGCPQGLSAEEYPAYAHHVKHDDLLEQFSHKARDHRRPRRELPLQRQSRSVLAAPDNECPVGAMPQSPK